MNTKKHIRNDPRGSKIKNPIDAEGYKVCNKCEEKKLAEEGFKYNKKKQRWPGWCISCEREYQQNRRKNVYCKTIKGVKIDEWRFKNRFGLTAKEVYDIMESQDMKCAICERPPNGRYGKLHIDHNHETGKHRGALCDSCNRMIGFGQDSADIMKRAYDYLKSYEIL